MDQKTENYIVKENKNKIKIIKIFIPIAILGIIGLVVFYSFLSKNSKNGEQLVNISGLSDQEVSFLMDSGFLPVDQGENKELAVTNLKSPGLVEQNLNSPNESFEVLATKLNGNNYQMVFRLENKSEQNKEFYLIPVSKKDQLQFEEIKGVVDNKNILSVSKEDAKKEPLEQLFDIEKHKKELNPELAKAYDDIKNSNYQPSPIKITLSPKSTLLAQSKWQIAGDRVFPGLEPVYFLVYGSAGGVKDDLIILNVHSSPQQGENWEVYFTTNGIADLKIIPNDQATIDDDEFVFLSCNEEKRNPQILQGDVIYYPNWECLPAGEAGSGEGKVVHYTKKAGKHTLRFEFGGQIAFAYNALNTSALLTIKSNLRVKGGFSIKGEDPWPLDEGNCDSLSGWYWYTTNGRSACWSKTLADSVSWNKGVGDDTDNPGAYTCAIDVTALKARMVAVAAGQWYKIVSDVNSVTITSSHNGSAGYSVISALAIADCLDGVRDLCTGDSCLGAYPANNTSLATWAIATGNKSALPYCVGGSCALQTGSDFYDACAQNLSNDLPLDCLDGLFYKNRKVCADGDANFNWAAAAYSAPTARILGDSSCGLVGGSGTSNTASYFGFRVVVRP